MERQDEKLIKLISGRQTKLESERANFNDRWQDIADYVIPHRDDIRDNLVKGHEIGKKIFDGTASSAAIIATDGIHGYHVSPAFPWFRYQMSRKDLNKIRQIKEWLEDVDYVMYTALNRSNFYSEAWAWIYDGFTIGTAPICAEEDLSEGKIAVEAIHPGEIYVQNNRYGKVDLIHRKMKRTVRQAVQMFGKENVGESIRNLYENSPFSDLEIIHAVFPREEYDSSMKDAKNKRYASVWWIKSHNVLARISGFDEFPVQVWRYMVDGKCPYGVTPGMVRMSDIKGLNIMSKTLLGAAQIAVDPAYNVPSYLQGKTQLRPRGINLLKNQDKITPVNTGSSFPVGVDREQEKQKSIREAFHVDTFLMLSQLAGQGQKTAYEVSELMAEKAAILGAELGPLNTCLDDFLGRIYDIEAEADRMPPPPDILLEMAANDPNLSIDPVYMGPLAQAQRSKFYKDGVTKFFLDISAIAQVNPECLDNVDFDAAVRLFGETDNVPQELLKDPKIVAQIRQARMQVQNQMSTMDGMGQIAGTMKTAADADKASGGAISSALAGAIGGQGA